MTILSITNRDMFYSLSWYMSARKTALRSALSFHHPLSITDQMDMRVHYSGYFLNLLAATELFRETKTLQPNNFESQLYSRFVFDGFQNGEANYSYIRELRNAIIHRGLNITHASHFDGNFPMILAEPKINNRSGKNTFFSFEKYLIHVIEKCESVVGSVMLDCLNAAGVFETTMDAEAVVTEYYQAVENSNAIPEEIQKIILAIEFKPEWATTVHNNAMTTLRDALAPCNVINPSRSYSSHISV